ncbi:MAG TPA: beta-galactosidase [Kribbella sp.]
MRDHTGAVALGYNPPFQHPVPSYRDRRYLDAVERWFTAVWRTIGDVTYPNGPVVAIQLDNEPSVCFQDSMYGTDYSDASIAAFRGWLRSRYVDDVAAWRAAWDDAGLSDFGSAEAPRPPSLAVQPANPRRLHDWIAFKTDTTAEYLADLKAMHERMGGQELLYTVNLVTHPIHDVPVSHAAISRTVGASVGEDHYYIPPLDTSDVHRLARSAATARAAGEPLPWVPELQAGIWRSPGEVVEYPDPTPLEQEIWWGAGLVLGFSGFNLYMLADRENWELAPLRADGGRSDFLAPVDRLVRVAQQLPAALTSPAVPVAVVAWHRPDAYAAYTVVGTSRIPKVDWYDADVAGPYQQWDATLLRLTELGLPYDLWDTATELTASPELPLIVPARCGLDPQSLDRIRATGRRVIEFTTQTELDQLTLSAPSLLGPHGREPRTLVGLRGGAVHLVHWGEGLDNAVLHLPAQPNGQLTCLSTGTRIPFSSDGAVLAVAPGHRVFTLS